MARISRRHVARRLGVSIATVCLLDAKGSLHPVKEGDRVFYDEQEVEAFRETYRPKRRRVDPQKWSRHSKKKALIMKMILAGHTRQEIVIAAEADPELVDLVYEESKLSFGEAARLKQEREAEKEHRASVRDHERWQRKQEWMRWREKIAKISKESA